MCLLSIENCAKFGKSKSKGVRGVNNTKWVPSKKKLTENCHGNWYAVHIDTPWSLIEMWLHFKGLQRHLYKHCVYTTITCALQGANGILVVLITPHCCLCTMTLVSSVCLSEHTDRVTLCAPLHGFLGDPMSDEDVVILWRARRPNCANLCALHFSWTKHEGLG
jgi:hypothetical protein